MPPVTMAGGKIFVYNILTIPRSTIHESVERCR